MLSESRQTIFIGLNWLSSPAPIINREHYLEFQQALGSFGVEYGDAKYSEQEIAVVCESPYRLVIRVLKLNPPIAGQLLVQAENPNLQLHVFTEHVEAAVKAFETTFSAPVRQSLQRDATFRDIYDSTAEHAFQELWERRLHQAPNSLSALGRPVLGGGLRFLMPPQPSDPEPVQVEVKIESYFNDTKKVFVETQFAWHAPLPPGMPFDPAQNLKQMDEYIEDTIEPFILGDLQ